MLEGEKLVDKRAKKEARTFAILVDLVVFIKVLIWVGFLRTFIGKTWGITLLGILLGTVCAWVTHKIVYKKAYSMCLKQLRGGKNEM